MSHSGTNDRNSGNNTTTFKLFIGWFNDIPTICRVRIKLSDFCGLYLHNCLAEYDSGF